MIPLILFLLIPFVNSFLGEPDEGDYRHLYPTACISVKVDNLTGGSSLSYAMGWIENLKYPKDRIKILVQIEEKDEHLIEKWLPFISPLYSYITHEIPSENWLEEGLRFGRQKKCEYILITTSDIFLSENSLKGLIDLKMVAVSGLVKDPFSYHSNGRDLADIGHLNGEKIESLRVYFARPPLLIHLGHKDSSYLTFDEQNLREFNVGSTPLEVLGHSAFSMDIKIYLDNHHHYGYLIDSKRFSSRQFHDKLSSFLYQLWMNSGSSSYFSPSISPWTPEANSFGFDQIYVVNLKRRPERRVKIEKALKLLGFQYKIFDAIDGKNLAESDLSKIKLMPNYLDPFHKRPLKRGEIGCFLSHYYIWEDIVANNYDRVLVFEDDIRFTDNATTILRGFLEDVMKTRLDWDFVYLGRKKNDAKNMEYFVDGHHYLSTVTYSYWTLGYALSLSGAKKLIASKPLEKLLALDEYLPIMYNQHNNEEWRAYFTNRNLNAYTLYPLVVNPEKYLHEPGYVSDTETSELIVNNDINQENANVHPAKSEL